MSTTSNPVDLYTAEDLARLWKCSTAHVRRMIWEGRLPSVRLGRAVRVAHADAERFIAEARTDEPRDAA